MKTLFIDASSHPNGCTFTALTELANTLQAGGLQTVRTLGRNIAFWMKNI